MQWLQFPTGTTAGSFTLSMSFGGRVTTTASIPYSATASTTQGSIQSALNTTFGTGLYTVTIPATLFVSTDTEDFLITASGGLANAILPLFTVAGTGLTSTPAVNAYRPGIGNVVQSLVLTGASGGTVQLALNADYGTGEGPR